MGSGYMVFKVRGKWSQNSIRGRRTVGPDVRRLAELLVLQRFGARPSERDLLVHPDVSARARGRGRDMMRGAMAIEIFVAN